MTIIIPMAGLSSRFTKGGYTLPQYMLYVKNKSLFSMALGSFNKYFKSANFVFVARELYDTRRFIDEECKLLGVNKYSIIILDKPTRGQAETVMEGVRLAGIKTDESILIFNIDTFRPNFTYPPLMELWDGYLEVFIGNGKNWSYALTESPTSTRVVETAEKREISNLCSTGIYYFKKAGDFVSAYEKMLESGSSVNEMYVAPLYNYMISLNKNIHVEIINREDVIFCGTPSEYEEQLRITCNR